MPPTSPPTTITLPPELGEFVRDRVASGSFQTPDEVVSEALRLLRRHEDDRDAAFADLKAKLERASAEADRGEFVEPQVVLKQIDQLRAVRM